MTYAEKLKNPKWQRKKAEIHERDNWACTLCSSTDILLHVHHEKYIGEPHEAPNKYLKTLCASCHAIVEAFKGMRDKVEIISIRRLPRKASPMFISCFLEKDTNKRSFAIYHYEDNDIKKYTIIGWECVEDLLNFFNTHQNGTD